MRKWKVSHKFFALIKNDNSCIASLLAMWYIVLNPHFYLLMAKDIILFFFLLDCPHWSFWEYFKKQRKIDFSIYSYNPSVFNNTFRAVTEMFCLTTANSCILINCSHILLLPQHAWNSICKNILKRGESDSKRKKKRGEDRSDILEMKNATKKKYIFSWHK